MSYKFSIQTTFVDNTTGKTSQISMDGDDPIKLGNSLSCFIQASVGLVNMSQDELKEMQLMIKQLIDTNKSKS